MSLKHIDEIRQNQTTIDALLEQGLLSKTDKKDKWLLDHLFQGDICSVGLAYANGHQFTFPEHSHPESKEYLICARGAFITTVENSFSRQVHPGECVTIEPGMKHVSVPLSPDTVIVYVCVPADKGMDNVGR